MRLKRPARQRALADDAVAAYTQWRGECAAVWSAYRRWVGASAAERPFAFGDYNAALNRGEQAASRYVHLMGRAGPLPGRGLVHQLAQIQIGPQAQ